MSPQVTIRPPTGDDVDAANAVAWSALQVRIPAEHFAADDDERRRRGRLRIGDPLATDPGGAWVADAGGGCSSAGSSARSRPYLSSGAYL